MAKYQKYAEYKDSGVEWLGAIPGHWGVTQLKRLGKFITGMTPSTAVEAYYSDEITEYGWIRPEDILEESEKVEPTKFLTKLGWETQRTIPAQSTLICCIGTIGKLGFLGKRAVTNQQITALVPNVRGFSKYYYYLLTASRNQLEHLATGNVVKILNSERLGSLWLPLLSSQNEARQIVHFLDHETAKIDSLIAKQEKLIELLKEKRQAVISHAVTKGLNPDVAMKNSGVEWLGEVPEHWTVSKFGYISQVVRGGSPRPAGDPTLFNGDYSPWVTVAEITKDDELYLTSTETFLTKKGSEQCRVFQSGTLLLSNSGATLGVPKILTINANANDGVVGFENLKIDTEYAYFYLSVLTNDLRERVKQGSGQPNLNTDIVKAISITIPPENEVKEIVADIKKKIDHFSKLMASAESAIQLMQERRTALISSAVTGKIDVRNWQHPNEAKMEFSA